MAAGGWAASADPHKDRPTGLPSVPKIFLNTTSRGKICLLPPDRYSAARPAAGPVCAASCGSCSLPNLACDPELVLARPASCDVKQAGQEVRSTSMMAAAVTADDAARGRRPVRRASGPTGCTGSAKLSVYCSPRVSRRGYVVGGGVEYAGCVHGGDHPVHSRLGEFSWLHNADLAKFIKNELNRRESNSSVESDSSLRSASHVSTCATSEYTRFTSCDRLSLPVHDLSPSFPLPTGRLRRIYSNPEAPFLKEGASGEMRDSKSCSDLKDQSRSLVDHSDLERKLSTDATHLLSPPHLMSTTGAALHDVSDQVDGAVGGGTLSSGHFLPVLGSPPPVDGWEERVVAGSSNVVREGGGGSVSRDVMIREWLQGVDPAIVVSSDYGAGAGTLATS